MIKVSTKNTAFNRAYLNAFRELPVLELESPRQYGQRWRETYRCRIDPTDRAWPHHVYIFERDEDYTWFMMRWS